MAFPGVWPTPANVVCNLAGALVECLAEPCNNTVMFEYVRHVPLRPLPWNTGVAEAAIEDAVRDAFAHFDPERFWPAHPLDDVSDGQTSFYFGATGMIWALDYLGRIGATTTTTDFPPILPKLLDANRAEFTPEKNSSK